MLYFHLQWPCEFCVVAVPFAGGDGVAKSVLLLFSDKLAVASASAEEQGDETVL